ncbi:MAG: cyanophycinase [Nocardiopsaceae bacterium]|nr:cyanophycinase [Nocardiopsaceae bacterium]
MDDGGNPGSLLIIGGAEDKCCGSGVLERFVELCEAGTRSHASGASQVSLVLVTTATGQPRQLLAEYERVFRKLGVRHIKELPISGRADADGEQAAAVLSNASGVFLCGGDQSRLQTLVGSKVNDLLRQRLADGLIVAGTSAGATALGRTMILGGSPDNGAAVPQAKPAERPSAKSSAASAAPSSAQSDAQSSASVRIAPGLGLLSRVLIDMHFGERGRLPRLLSAVALDPDRLGIGIDENTAALVQQDTFEVLGSGTVTVVDAQRAPIVHAASDQDPITLFDVRLHLLPAGCVFDLAARSPAIGPAHARY